ncbi:MAG: nitronate monooxygenase [Legionella longbeachae]|nr:nitronate monooxygenase [Legionella longbeachae]
MWKTKLTEKLGIQFPIIQAPMAGGATSVELIAAVSNAGGLGSLGAGYMTPDEIRKTIKKIRELTSNPFAVNLFIPEKYFVTTHLLQKACDVINRSCIELNMEIKPIREPYAQSFEDQINILIEEKIPVFSYTFGTLSPEWVKLLKINNTFLIGTATTLEEALILEGTGADMIVAQGSEAGGHRGTFLDRAEDALMGLFSLIPQLVNKTKIPIIAAGGIMNGTGLIAAIDLGADGVQMGTAFLSTLEAGIPHAYKQLLLNLKQDNTVLTRAFSGKLARGIRNKFTEHMNDKIENILDYPIQNKLTNSMRKKAKETNNIDFMSLWAGQAATLCRNIPAGELVKTLIYEAEELNLCGKLRIFKS